VNYEWNFSVPTPDDLRGYGNINPLLAAALYKRRISKSDADLILNHSYDGFCNPLKLLNITAAAKILYEFITNPKAHIYIYGDYDTDGITATATAERCIGEYHEILSPYDKHWALRYHIPERTEGYGLSREWSERIVILEEGNEENVLVLTVDNGITKKPEVDILLAHGITVLITDHHIPDWDNNMTPDCVYVDPWADPMGIGKSLCGCVVIFNVLRHFEDLYLPQYRHSVTNDCIYLAAFGTIGDMMNMDRYNACLVSCALRILNSNRCPAWVYDVTTYLKTGNITSKTIGFTLSAFINACGQAGNAALAYNIIMETDDEEREKLLRDAIATYNDVKNETKKAKANAEEALKTMDDHYFIIYGFKAKNPGIVGKVAYYISSLTNKPTIVYNDNDEDEIIKGSGRNENGSISSYTILKEAQKDGVLISVNGHDKAHGCEFRRDNIHELQNYLDGKVIKALESGESTLEYTKELTVDSVISPDDISMKNVNALEVFPFSKNWSEPSVCILDATLERVHSSKNNDKNICYTIKNSHGKEIELWAWNLKPNSYNPRKHTKISLIGTLSRDFRNTERPIFNITDFKLT
jgi:single-stranded-DNA-specific exonuclease